MSNFRNPTTNRRYIYSSASNAWSLPSNCSPNSIYEYTSDIRTQNSKKFTLVGKNNNEEMTWDKTGYIKFGVYKNGKLLDNNVVEININGTKENIKWGNEYFDVNITDIVKNDATNPEHEQYTPNYIRYKCNVTVNQSELLGSVNGASYSIAAIINSNLPDALDKVSIKSKEVFIYNSGGSNKPSVDFDKPSVDFDYC